jgi:uncharacterized protein (TIGR02217 family)
VSTAVFPSASAIPGVTFNVKRTPTFQNRTVIAISGRETRIAEWSLPRYSYELVFEFLRTEAVFQELQQLAAFYLNRQGGFDSFLFDDVDDDSATAQLIGTGDGSTVQFQLSRAYGKPGQPLWVDPIYAPIAVTALTVAGVTKVQGTDYGVGTWQNGVTPPGTVNFLTGAPAVGAPILATFTYYWPCRFAGDTLDFTKFMKTLWLAQKVGFMTIK